MHKSFLCAFAADQALELRAGGTKLSKEAGKKWGGVVRVLLYRADSEFQETKVGMAVNKLRMNPDKSVSELAKEIVSKWKKDVHQKTKPGSSSGSQDAGGKKERTATASPTMTNTMSPPKPSGKKPEGKSKVDPSKRNKNTDGVSWAITGDQVRNNCIGAMYDALVFESDACNFHPPILTYRSASLIPLHQ